MKTRPATPIFALVLLLGNASAWGQPTVAQIRASQDAGQLLALYTHMLTLSDADYFGSDSGGETMVAAWILYRELHASSRTDDPEAARTSPDPVSIPRGYDSAAVERQRTAILLRICGHLPGHFAEAMAARGLEPHATAEDVLRASGRSADGATEWIDMELRPTLRALEGRLSATVARLPATASEPLRPYWVQVRTAWDEADFAALMMRHMPAEAEARMVSATEFAGKFERLWSALQSFTAEAARQSP